MIAAAPPSPPPHDGDQRLLRKGRGLQPGQRADRIGPTLRAVCTITDDDRPIETLTKVGDWMRDAIIELPQDLQISVLGAYGLHENARHHYLKEREQWIAAQLDRDPRTVRRRINAALTCIAESAAYPPKEMVDLRGFVGQQVTLTIASGGTATSGVSVCKCYLLAVPWTLDDRGRFFAVVDTISPQPATIAIPTSRILGVAPLNDVTGHRRARSNRPRSGQADPPAQPSTLTSA